ncbi:MAG: hypothetical protein KJ077_11300 [Anaerolineae bacterium]|nr:hypothetical protein [Anaerolineae bacterium]
MALAQATAVRLPFKNNSIHSAFTSPPYYGLRVYDLEPQIWGGRSDCLHEWEEVNGQREAGRKDGWRRGKHSSFQPGEKVVGVPAQKASLGQFCRHCRAWYGHLGNEPSIELYIEHMVEIGHEVMRVLRSEGVWFLNLGDSYANDRKWGGDSGSKNGHSCEGGYDVARVRRKTGLKPKDKMGIPERVVLALQAAGWYWRATLPWLKVNALPESVEDRPTIAHEYVYILARSSHPYWDYYAMQRQAQLTLFDEGGLRRYRTSDPWYDSLDTLIAGVRGYLAHLEAIRNNGGLLLDPEGEPLALNVPTVAYKGTHYATFPPNLVRDLLRGTTSEHGVCSGCGAPWRRVIRKPDFAGAPKRNGAKLEGEMIAKGTQFLTSAGTSWQQWREQHPDELLGFEPTCTCNRGGLALRPDDREIIATPTGSDRPAETTPVNFRDTSPGLSRDPSVVVGRAGFSRPRGEREGSREITRYEQRAYAAQLRRSPHRAEMMAEAGEEAFKHYLRTDRSGARPVPPDLLARWSERGWLEPVSLPDLEPLPVVAALVLDPFCGSGTVGQVCREWTNEGHPLRFVGTDLSGEYLAAHAAVRAERRTTAAALAEHKPRGATRTAKVVEGQASLL